MRRIIEAIAKRLAPPRIIMDREGGTPYLSRYYLLGDVPYMPDGSAPFDETGEPKRGAIWPPNRLALYLHKFHRGDDDHALHNHPWEWALSFVLVGGYSEERRIGDRVVRREVCPGSINFISANDFHRVDLRDGEAWTLFLVGPKTQGWGFWDRDTREFLPWRQFIARIRGDRWHQ